MRILEHLQHKIQPNIHMGTFWIRQDVLVGIGGGSERCSPLSTSNLN